MSVTTGDRGDEVIVHRLILLLSTPRIAPGLFSRDAWTALANAAHVLTRDEDETQLIAIQEAGIAATHLGEQPPGALARLLVDQTADGEVVWIGSADGDPGLTDALAAEVSGRDDPPEIELLFASYDVPGSRLLDLVAYAGGVIAMLEIGRTKQHVPAGQQHAKVNSAQFIGPHAPHFV